MFKDLKKTIKAVQEGFGRPRVLVVGDLVLNQYYWGQVGRISPEAPVPVLHVEHEVNSPGGAANVACNLAKLGCEVALAGTVGDDAGYRGLMKGLSENDVDTSDVLPIRGHSTALKTRVVGGHQQILHIDTDNPFAVSPLDSARLLDAVLPKIKHYSALMLSDYGKGTLTDDACRRLISEARRCSVPIFVDPHGRDYQKYAGATALTPNRAEIALATGSPLDDLEYLLQRTETLRAGLNVDFIFLTLGELGIVVLETGSVYRCAADAQQVFDISGAGDAVVAALTAALVSGLDRHDCAHLANAAAGIVIGKVGTMAVSRYELLATLSQESLSLSTKKICTVEQLQQKVACWRANGERIVFTNGFFDLLHVGHITLLQRGRQEGDRLIVGLNGDESAGPTGAKHPVVGELERAQLLASMSMVDAVVIFDEDTPIELIRVIRPDVLVKGAEYREEEVVGAAEVRSWGGKVALVPLVDVALSEV